MPAHRLSEDKNPTEIVFTHKSLRAERNCEHDKLLRREVHEINIDESIVGYIYRTAKCDWCGEEVESDELVL